MVASLLAQVLVQALQENSVVKLVECMDFPPDRMDQDPKTRKESKKSAKDKAKGKDTCYSAKHVRQLEALKDKKK